MEHQEAGQLSAGESERPSQVEAASCSPVPSCPAAQKRVAFDCVLLDAAAPVQALLDEQGAGGADLVLVQEPEGLLQDSLTLRVSLTDSGGLLRAPGRLFDNASSSPQRPLCLVLDCRKLSAAQLVAYNDLLDPDNPSCFDRCSKSRQPLGSHVRLLVLLSQKQYQPAIDAARPPGMDFWRRVVRPELTLDWIGSHGLQDLPPLRQTAELVHADRDAVIDFCLQGDWRRTLYGSMGVDAHGRMRFSPGALDRLSPGQRVILQGADWSDAVLCHAWLKVQRTGLYESNGCQRQLPDGLTFVRTELDDQQLQRLGRSVLRHAEPGPGSIVVNNWNLNQWLAQGRVNEDGSWQQSDVLQERLARGAGLIVSAPLGAAGWLRLLHRLRAADRGEGGTGVFVAHDDSNDRDLVPLWEGKQKASVAGENSDDETMESAPGAQQVLAAAAAAAAKQRALARVLSPQVRIRSWQDADQITAWLASQKSWQSPPQVIRVHPGTRLGVLFDDLHVLSEQRPLFGLRKTALENALMQGTPVMILGLETNPELQWQLESLLCQTPSLLINGRWRSFPAAQVTLLWPQSMTSASPLWSQALAAAVPLAAVDQWAALSRRWQLDESRTAQLRQAVTSLLSAWASVPAHLAARAGSLPVVTASLLDNLVAAALHQARQEGSDRPAPHHWRHGIDSVLSHRSRGCPPVRDFLKAVCIRLWPDAGPVDWVDPDRLVAVVPEQAVLDRAFFKKHLWTLMRALGPGWLPGLSWEFHPGCTDENLSVLVAVLRIWGADVCKQVSVEKGLEPDELLQERLRRAPIRCGQRLKRLGDALAAGWRRGAGCKDVYPALMDLAAASYRLAGKGEQQAQAQLQARLPAVLEWDGAVGIEAAATAALTRDLLLGCTDQADRQQRRLARLRQRLEQTPVLMIEGRTATGKSHFAAQVARQAGPFRVISVGSGTTERDLVQRWVWKDQGQDRTMEACDQLILEWAGICPASGGQLVTLVIDEANLASPGVLDSLKGLWNQPPCVYIKGRPLLVSDRHRVILTGNPVGYAGRHWDPDFARLAPQLHFPPLDEDFLGQQVVLPALQSHLARHVSPALIQETAVTLMRVWDLCHSLLPGRVFTARDLVDLCAWLGWYVSRSEAGVLTAAGLNALVLQAVPDLLEGECDQAGRLALQALEVWMEARVPVDRSCADRCGGGRSAWLDSRFVQYARHMAPDFATSPPAVMALVSALNRDLDRCLQARQGRLAAGRRQATLIEGPAGRGKDASLRLLLDFWQQECRHEGEAQAVLEPLCAADCPWESLCAALRQARTEGKVLVVSELNLVESRYLEGELNAALAGEAAPGFHLFATVNPAAEGLPGRHVFSPALLGRFRRLVLPDYSHEELTAIALQSAAGQVEEAQVRQLAVWHRQLCQVAQNKGLMLRPVNQSLMQLVRACKGCSPRQVEALFDSHYKMYLRAASSDRASLSAVTVISEERDRPRVDLTQWVNRCQWLDRPLTIGTGDAHRGEQEGRLVLPSGLSDEQARELLLSELIKVRWRQETGLPATPPAGPGLVVSLYRHMQQRWCHKLPEAEQERALKLLSPSPAQQQTLDIPCNNSCVKRVSALYLSWPHSPWQWQLLWRRIHALCVQSGDGTHRFLPPRLHKSVPFPMDARTAKDAEPMTEKVLPGTFGADHDDTLSRLAIKRPVCVDGCPGLEGVPPGQRGYEAVLPAAMPGDAVSLDHRQYYGIYPLKDTDDWQALPSVHVADQMLQLGTKPPRTTEVIRDSDTGFHYVRFLDAGFCVDDPVMVHFVLEKPDSRHKNPVAPASGPEGIHPDACCDPDLLQRLDAIVAQATENRAGWAPQTLAALRRITQARSNAERVRAIYYYCRAFQALKTPAPGEDLLAFLLRERQGSCRHRCLVHALLCRRWGIAARVLFGCGHSVVEYSLDGGRSWAVHDLGGAKVRLKRRAPPAERLAHRRVCTSVKNFVQRQDAAGRAWLLAHLRLVDEEPPAASAPVVEKASGLAAQSETAARLDRAYRLSEAQLLQCLWGSRVMEGFVLGCCFVQGITNPATVRTLMSDLDGKAQFLAGVVSELCLQSSGIQMEIRQQLTQLGVWARRHGDWQRWRFMFWHFVKVLISKLYRSLPPPALGEDMVCWLVQQDEFRLHAQNFSALDLGIKEQLEKLARLEGCRNQAQLLQQAWYQAWFHTDMASDWFDTHAEPMVGNIGFRACNPCCYGGRLSSLESELLTHAVGEGWTDQPEGVPDVERLLMQQPAFRTCRPVIAGGRSVVLVGGPWSGWNRLLSSQVVRLLNGLAPGQGESRKLQDSYHGLVRWAFCCCLYETVCRQGGALRVQMTWRYEQSFAQEQGYVTTGLMAMNSVEQLINALTQCPPHMVESDVDWSCEAPLRAACNEPDTLVISSRELDDLVEEFVDTMDPEALVQAMGPRLREQLGS